MNTTPEPELTPDLVASRMQRLGWTAAELSRHSGIEITQLEALLDGSEMMSRTERAFLADALVEGGPLFPDEPMGVYHTAWVAWSRANWEAYHSVDGHECFAGCANAAVQPRLSLEEVVFKL